MVVMSKKRRNSKPEFKAQVVLELLREEKTVNELADSTRLVRCLSAGGKPSLLNMRLRCSIKAIGSRKSSGSVVQMVTSPG
jgi:hypothetical protein